MVATGAVWGQTQQVIDVSTRIGARPGQPSFSWTYGPASTPTVPNQTFPVRQITYYDVVDIPAGFNWVLTRGKFQYSTNGGGTWLDLPHSGTPTFTDVAGKIFRFLDQLPADTTTTNDQGVAWTLVGNGDTVSSGVQIVPDLAPTGIVTIPTQTRVFDDTPTNWLVAGLNPTDTGTLLGGAWRIDSQSVPNLFTITGNNTVTDNGELRRGSGTMPAIGSNVSVTARYYDLYQTDSSGTPIAGQGFAQAFNFVVTQNATTDIPGLGSEFQVNSFTTNTQNQPAIARLSNGNVVVVWRSAGQDSDVSPNSGIYARIYNASGVAQGAEFRISPLDDVTQNAPVVAALSGGRFVVAYTHNNDDVNFRMVDAAGTVGAVQSAPAVTTGTETGPRIAALADGNFVIAWLNAAGDVGARVFNGTTGAPVAADFTINATTTGTQNSPDVAAMGGGNFIVVWRDPANSGDVLARTGNAAGPVSAEWVVAGGANNQNSPRVAGFAGGNFTVAFTDVNRDGDAASEANVYLQRYSAANTPSGGQVRANATVTGSQITPFLTAMSDGGVFVGWQVNAQDLDGNGLFGRRFDSSGVAIDASDAQLNHKRQFNQTNGAIAGGSAGTAAIAWVDGQQEGQGATNSGIEARVLNPVAVPNASIAVAPASTPEDGPTNLTYTVSLDSPAPSAITVNITTSGTATSGSDYTGGVATVNIAAGSSSATIIIDPTVDGTVEPDETVTLAVTNGSGYAVGAPASATATIANDDVTLPTLTLTKISQGGVGAFTFTGNNGWTSQTITTTSSGVGVSGATQTLSAAGVATTVTETAPPGYALVSASCTGMGGGGTATLTGNTLTLSAAATAAGANIACSFTNAKLPTLTLTKISQGGVGGFTFTGNNGWSSQTITTTSSGVGVSGATQTLVVAGAVTTISETVPAGYALTAVSCTGMGSGGTAVMAGSSVTLDAAATAAGANIACTFTNRKLPTLTLTKISQGGVGGFTFTGNNGWSSQTITTTSSGVGVSGATQTLTAAGVAIIISEALPAGYVLAAANCTGMGPGGSASLVGNTLTLDGAATAPGANIACTFTNAKLPTLTLTKISQGGVGGFTFTGNNGWMSQTITTTTSGTGVSGATQTLTAAGVVTTISEAVLSGYALTAANCTGMGPGGSASLVGNTLTLDGAATAAGANIACSFTNLYTVPDAVDDSFGPINGASGATTASVLANDTQAGNPATVGVGGNVALTPGAAPAPTAGSIAMNLDGTVAVAAGTTAGTYAYPYTLCELANPANCDAATATIDVIAAPIVASDDVGTVANGANGGVATANVLVNDTLNGGPATLANVTLTQLSTTHPNVTLNPATGGVNAASATPAGTFTVVYQLCEQLNPANCDSATVTVTVGAAVIDAVDDAGTVANGAVGGVAVANVLSNDTLNGAPATLSGVTLTQTSTTHPNVSLNPATGEVVAAPGTPGGTHTVVYTICEILNSTNCDTAAVAVTTIDPPPVASDSALTVAYNAPATNVPLNLTGGPATSLAIGIAPLHGIAMVSGTTISYQPTTGYAGADSFTYTATNDGGTSAPATVTITVQDPVVTITPSGGFAATVASPYTQTFTFNGGATPWNGYQVTNLPAGLSITGTSANTVTVSGTPTQAGGFNLDVSATDSSTGTGPYTIGQAFTLTVAAPTLALAPAPGTLNAPYAVAYSQAFSASGGIGPYTYVASGALPAGLALSGDTISGTPTAPGSYPITVTATDTGATGTGAPFTVAQNYTIVVPAPTIDLSPTTLPNGTAGTSYNQALSGSGGAGPYAFTVSAGGLPPGLALGGSGVLSGTPTSAGSFNFTVTATDTNSQAGSRAYTVAIAVPTLTLLPATLPGGVNGVPYSQALTASGGVAPYTFALTGGTLPTGLNLGGSGVLSGTPTQFGNFSITVTVTDSTEGTAATISQTYALTMSPVIVVSTAGVPSGLMGVAYNGQLTASGGASPYTFAVTGGSLPPGLTLAANGAISGTPSSMGASVFTVTVTDNQGFTGTAQITLAILSPFKPIPAGDPWAMALLMLMVLVTAAWGLRRLG